MLPPLSPVVVGRRWRSLLLTGILLGATSVAWAPGLAGHEVTAGLYTGDTAAKVTSGISYFGSVVGCLLGTPISQTTGLIDSLVLTG